MKSFLKKIPWSLDNIKSYDELSYKILIEKKTPLIIDKDSIDSTSKFLINIMKKCFIFEPEKRPTFDNILRLLTINQNSLDDLNFIKYL